MGRGPLPRTQNRGNASARDRRKKLSSGCKVRDATASPAKERFGSSPKLGVRNGLDELGDKASRLRLREKTGRLGGLQLIKIWEKKRQKGNICICVNTPRHDILEETELRGRILKRRMKGGWGVDRLERARAAGLNIGEKQKAKRGKNLSGWRKKQRRAHIRSLTKA